MRRASVRIGQVGLVAAITLVMAIPPRAIADTPLTTIRVATGFAGPLFVTAPPGDTTRLFVVEQNGRIKILTGGSVLATPDLRSGR